MKTENPRLSTVNITGVGMVTFFDQHGDVIEISKELQELSHGLAYVVASDAISRCEANEIPARDFEIHMGNKRFKVSRAHDGTGVIQIERMRI